MARKTEIHIKYRTPYIPHIALPQETEKQMRREITDFRKDLIRKQGALARSNEYSANEKLLNQLQNIKVRDLNTPADVWKTWNRLYLLEQAHSTSVTGKRESERLTLETLQQEGFTELNTRNFRDFYTFMNYAKDNSGAKVYDSNKVAKFYMSHIKDGTAKIYDEFKKWNANQTN